MYEVWKHPMFQVDTPRIIRDIKSRMVEKRVEFHIYKLGEQVIVEGKGKGKLNNGK
jgi:hypothetical protein